MSSANDIFLGGPRFVAPLYAGQVVTLLLAALSPSESHPQVVIHALRSLNAIADSAQLSCPTLQLSGHEYGISSLLYAPTNLARLHDIFFRSGSSLVAEQQVDLAAILLIKTCVTERQRTLAAQSGLLPALAHSIAPLVKVTLTARDHDYTTGYNQSLQPRLSVLLKVFNVLIKGSRSRAIQFLSATPLSSVFASVADELESTEDDESWTTGKRSPPKAKQGVSRILEHLMPQLPNPHSRSASTNHVGNNTPSGSGIYSRSAQLSHSRSTAIEVHQNSGVEYVGEEESPMIPWLLSLFRNQGSALRLVAAETLVTINRLGLVKRSKELLFPVLLVPPLVRMLDKNVKSCGDPSHSSEFSIPVTNNAVTAGEASAVLAMLMSNNLETQRAAVDAGVIKKLSRLLKESFDPLPETIHQSNWKAEPDVWENSHAVDFSVYLGQAGISYPTFCMYRTRESVLVALAALAFDKEEYRKEIIDNGVIHFVIETLKLNPSVSSGTLPNHNGKSAKLSTGITWNRDSILAACGTARALSRSVSSLRTSLMDAGLAAPLFVLLTCDDVDIQVATTAVVCNLILDFSTMREVREVPLPVSCDAE